MRPRGTGSEGHDVGLWLFPNVLVAVPSGGGAKAAVGAAVGPADAYMAFRVGWP
jgi:hypothetical protein